MKQLILLLCTGLLINSINAQKKNNSFSIAGGPSFHQGSAYETGYFFRVTDALAIDQVNNLNFSFSYQKWRYKNYSSHPGILTFLVGDKFWAVPNRFFINPEIGISQGISGYPNEVGFAACIEAGYHFSKKLKNLCLVSGYTSSRNLTDTWINVGLGYSFLTNKK